MKIAAFDLEIAKILPDDTPDWQAHRPLGITCAAVLATGPDPLIDDWDFTWKGTPQLTPSGCQDMVKKLQWLADQGYTIVTVNGLGFDFQILAEESDMWRECAYIALLHHCDFMLMSLCGKGWPTGLNALAEYAGSQKLKSVTLKDGSALNDMHGAVAPQLWADGEYEAVLTYLNQDVKSTLAIAQKALDIGYLGWHSSTGRFWSVGLSQDNTLPTVDQTLKWPRPNTSWMTNPINPDSLAQWAWESDAP